VAREKLKRAVEKALEPAWAEAARRHGETISPGRGGRERRLWPHGASAALDRLVQELRRHVAHAARVRFGIAHREAGSGARTRQLEQETLFALQLRRCAHPDAGLRQPLPGCIGKQRLLRMPFGKL